MANVSSEMNIDIPKGKQPVAGYIERLSQALRSEQMAINEYAAILQEPSLTVEVRDTISEIIEDEKDHMVLIASLLSEEIQTAFPNNTDELPDKHIVKEAVEGDALSLSMEKISTDSLAGTTTWRIYSNVKVTGASKSAVSAAVEAVNETIDEDVSFVDINDDGIITKVTAGENVSVGRAKEIMTDIAEKCDESI